MVSAKIEGTDLVIRIPLNSMPVPSSSGKTLVVASSHGNKQTEAKIAGKAVTVGVPPRRKTRSGPSTGSSTRFPKTKPGLTIPRGPAPRSSHAAGWLLSST
jgi:hypothetical protein